MFILYLERFMDRCYTKFQGGDEMVDNELLTAIGQMMDTKLEKALQPIKDDIAELKNGQDGLKKGYEELKDGQDGLQRSYEELKKNQEEMKDDLEGLRKDVRILKHDVKEIGWKVDTLYDWVDGIDLKVKKIENRTTA